MFSLTWGDGPFPLHFTDEPGPVVLGVADEDAPEPSPPGNRSRPALVEVLAVGQGRALTSLRSSRTAIGDRLRYLDHEVTSGAEPSRLIIRQADPVTGLQAVTTIEQHGACAAYRFTVRVENPGPTSLLIQQVTSVALGGLTAHLGPRVDLDLWQARSEWCAESRWFATDLGGPAGPADINMPMHGHVTRGAIAQAGHSTWSSGEFVPVAGIENRATGRAIAWQIENNGPWRWEITALDDDADGLGLGLALLGPTDLDHSWSTRLDPGDSFVTVPATIALSADGLTGAIGELTVHRRRSHLDTTADAERPLIFNDYMNALFGDPTTEKLLPLIDAAAAVGARYFCIDAGWYDDGGDWWPSVGAWEPSTVRFGRLGLSGVLDHIRDKGMVPGLWVEPEVVGVRSPVADLLPEDAFMRRGGIRIVEQDRYFLDLRSQAARDHLDAVFARLIGEYGARYFKWDYNVTPGTGPDTDTTSPGDGLLGHTRAHLAWVEALRARYPDVILEACSSGAQRMDPAILAHYDLQSTTDQVDYRLYPAIAAAAPMAMPPEQAGNWAYPQPEWSLEQVAFTLVTGLSGRMYLSGHPNRLSADQFALVQEAAAMYPDVIRHHARALPAWPLGLPGWDDPQIAVASITPDEALIFVWNRSQDATGAALRLPQFAGRAVDVDVVFPRTLAAWRSTWAAADQTLAIDFTGTGESARVLRVRPR